MKENGCTKEEINSVLSNLSETEKHLSLLPQLYSDVDPNYADINLSLEEPIIYRIGNKELDKVK